MAFKLIRSEFIQALNSTFEQYQDEKTGAVHIHLANDNPENVFLVAFPTLPPADDGRAHILEHLALCGSKKYPTRDPFFAMLRRSLATFMNAMTYPDKTVYPFATQDQNDYFNLLGVYLDAAFHPKLDYLDFRQEGWRIELDAQGKPSVQGVVYNEMKGANANPSRAIWKGIEKAVKPNTPYSFDSGGDPSSIPSLDYKELLQFHKLHYHPSRAVFMSFGNIPAALTQAKIQSEVLEQCQEKLPTILPGNTQQIAAPRKAQVHYPAQPGNEEFGFQMTWLLGESSDPDLHAKAEIMAQALMGDSASPLMNAIESAGFGQPSILMGADSHSKQMTFHVGMQGLERKDIPKAKTLIVNTLRQIAQDGVPHERLETVVRDFELASKEVSGSSQPYGLNLLLQALPKQMYGGDALEALHSQPAIEKARLDIQNPEYLKNAIKTLILDNPNLTETEILPDAKAFERANENEEQLLSKIQQSLTADDIQKIQSDSEQLKLRQREKADFSCLPMIKPSQINPEPQPGLDYKWTLNGSAKPSAFLCPAPTNGVAYAKVVVDASEFNQDDWPWLNFYTDVADQMGFGEHSYTQTEEIRRKACARFGVTLGSATRKSDGALMVRVNYSASGLDREADGISFALSDSAEQIRFDDHERLLYAIKDLANSAKQSLANSASFYASSAAQAPFSASARFSEATSGSSNLTFIQNLAEQAQNPEGLAQIAQKLSDIHAKLNAMPSCLFLAGDKEVCSEILDDYLQKTQRNNPLASPDSALSPFYNPKRQETPKTALTAETLVNHVCCSFEAVPGHHPDAPKLTVLAKMLTNGFLHRAIREEGGAYGSGASFSGANKTFSMTSYRDPRLDETIADFKKSVEWFLAADHTQEELDQAIVCSMQSLDKPSSPRGQAEIEWARAQNQVQPEDRQNLRTSILNCTVDELKDVCRKYLCKEPDSCCVFTGPAKAAESALGFEQKPVSVGSAPKKPKP